MTACNSVVMGQVPAAPCFSQKVYQRGRQFTQTDHRLFLDNHSQCVDFALPSNATKTSACYRKKSRCRYNERNCNSPWPTHTYTQKINIFFKFSVILCIFPDICQLFLVLTVFLLSSFTTLLLWSITRRSPCLRGRHTAATIVG